METLMPRITWCKPASGEVPVSTGVIEGGLSITSKKKRNVPVV